MGFSVSAAAAVIGIAILISFELLVADVIPTVTETYDSYDDMKKRAIDQVQTDINITSVSTPANDSNYDLNITVENTGSVTLETEKFNILINGTSKTFTCSKTYLHPNNQVYFNVTNQEGVGSRRLKVVSDNGISDYFTYTIT